LVISQSTSIIADAFFSFWQFSRNKSDLILTNQLRELKSAGNFAPADFAGCLSAVVNADCATANGAAGHAGDADRRQRTANPGLRLRNNTFDARDRQALAKAQAAGGGCERQ
jgi:hypothetical protein